MFFSRKKHFLVFGVLVFPNKERQNFESAACINRPFINQKVMKNEMRKQLMVDDDVVIIFTNIIRLSKTEYNEWSKICLN